MTDRGVGPGAPGTAPAERRAPYIAGRILVAGGAGFIGSAYVRNILARRDGTLVTVLDKLTYAGNRANLASIDSDPEQRSRLAFIEGDIADPTIVGPLVRGADAVVNFAAETHVDRSLSEPSVFRQSNVVGVQTLLEALEVETRRADEGRRSAAPRLVHVSTDEVYGPRIDPATEEAPLAPTSPYAATKAAADLLVASSVVGRRTDALVTRGCNTYGPYQHPEKLIPLSITNAIDDVAIPLYGDGSHERDWLYVDDHAEGVDWVLRHGGRGGVYNLPGGELVPNREIVGRVLVLLDKPWSLVRRVADRPGHDRRYELRGQRIAALGWQKRTGLGDGLAATVAWYSAREDWWRAIRAGDWRRWYEHQYAERLARSVPG